jgi:Contact-dependent growth inhibition CdiA C-terminal domain
MEVHFDEELENLKKLTEQPVAKAIGEFIVRSLFDPLDILMSILDFLKKPGRDTALNLGLSLIPGALAMIGKFGKVLDNIPGVSWLIEKVSDWVRRRELLQRGFSEDAVDAIISGRATAPGSGDEIHRILEHWEDPTRGVDEYGRPLIRDNPANDANISIENANARTLRDQYGYEVIHDPNTQQLWAVGYFDNAPAGRLSPTRPRDGRIFVDGQWNLHRNPDYIIDDRVFDNYAHTGSDAETVWKGVARKLESQSDRIVLDLSNSTLDFHDINTNFNTWYVDPNFPQLLPLQEMIVMKNGKIIGIWLPP